MTLTAVAAAATVSAILSVGIAKLLRLPWWGLLCAAIVAWFGLALHLSIWEVHPGDSLPLAVVKLSALPTLAGIVYAIVTRGFIGPPEGPLPRSR